MRKDADRISMLVLGEEVSSVPHKIHGDNRNKDIALRVNVPTHRALNMPSLNISNVFIGVIKTGEKFYNVTEPGSTVDLG